MKIGQDANFAPRRCDFALAGRPLLPESGAAIERLEQKSSNNTLMIRLAGLSIPIAGQSGSLYFFSDALG